VSGPQLQERARGTNRRVLCRNIELYNALEPEQWQIQSAYVLLGRQMENVCRVQDGQQGRTTGAGFHRRRGLQIGNYNVRTHLR